jgi:hypothetical protein
MALNDRELLAKTLQAEAGNQGIGGMLAVGSVIRNRMAQGGSLSDVILAPAQFSAWNKVTGAVGGEQGQDMAAIKPSEDAYAAADAILSGNAPDLTGGATHYYNPSISNPAWGKEKAGGDWTKIGAHIFGKAGDFRTGAAKMNGEQTQKPQGLLGGLLGGQGIGGALGMSDDFRDKLKMAILAGTGDARMDPLIRATAARMEERRGEAKEQRQRNKSIEFLKSRADAGDVLAKQYYEAASTGVLPVGAGIAGYLGQMTKVPKTSEKERSIQRLVDTGMDRNTATLITEGVLVTSRDPVTGNAVVINKATGTTVGQLPSSVADAVAEASPAAGDGGAFEGLDISSALGVRGWTSSILNKVTDAVGAGQAAGEAGEVEAALDNLKARTILMSGIDVEGKPSNFTREIIERDFTIPPSQLSTGPVAALQKATQMVDMLEQTLSAVEVAAGGGGGASAQQVREARASRSGIENLLADYRSLKDALEKKGVSSGAANGQPTVVQTDQDRALIQKWANPNYYRDNMLPSPE